MPEDNIDIGALLGEAVGEQPNDMVAPTTPEPEPTDGNQNVEPTPVAEDPIQQPEFNPAQLTDQMNDNAMAIQGIAKQMNDLTNNIPKPEAPQPTEDDLLREQMKKDLGLDKMEEQFNAQKEIIDAQNKRLELQEQAEIKRGRELEFKSMEAEFGNVDRVAIQNKIMEIGKSNPALAEALNSPDGVRMLLSQGVGAVVKTPDAITPSASGQSVDTSNQVQALRDGNLNDSDFGQLLLDSSSL